MIVYLVISRLDGALKSSWFGYYTHMLIFKLSIEFIKSFNSVNSILSSM